MQIYGPAQIHGAQPVNPPHTKPGAQHAPPASPGQGDKLEISQAAELASQLSEVPEIRHDRVAELRAAIDAGRYETDERIDGAVEKLLDELV